MRFIRHLFLAIIVVSIGIIVFSPLEEAQAQTGSTIFEGPGFLEIIPAGEVVGNGVTSVTLHVLALKPDGTPMTGLKLKASASGGAAGVPVEVGGGLYSFTYLSGTVRTPTTAQITVKGKIAQQGTITASYNLPVRPPLSNAIKAVSNPRELVLGQDKESTVSFTLDGAMGSISPRDLAITASAGEIANLTHLGKGRFTARYVSPKVNFPQMAILTFTDRRNPSSVYGGVAIPLVGKTDYPVRSVPGATVILRIGDREFGPIQADETGKARVPVLVPPGIQFATKIQVQNGSTTEDKIDLRVPETKRVQLIPVHSGVPADGSTKVPIRAVVLTPVGKPDTNAGVNFTATGGTISQARHEGGGVYVADFTPKFSNEQISGTVAVGLRGSSVQEDKAEFLLVPTRPESVTLKPEPARLSEQATTARVFAKVMGPNGLGMPQRALSFYASGARLKGSVQDLRNGDYRADFSTTGNTHVDIVGLVQSSATGNPLANILVFPTDQLVSNDALSSTSIVVVTTDEFGAPVPNQNVKLQLESGDGTIPSGLTTNAGGVGTVLYTSGRRTGVVRVRASSGNHTGSVSLLQGPAGIASVDLARSGTAKQAAFLESWKKSVSTLRIERDGATEVIATVDVGTGEAGVIQALQVTPSPTVVAGGGSVRLVIKATDDQGRGVSGQKFELMCSAGMFGPLQDQGGGTYDVVMTVPPKASGEIKVSVSTATGNTSTFLKIPVSEAQVAENGNAWEDNGQGGDMKWSNKDQQGGQIGNAGEDAGSDRDHPWIRIGGGFVGSSYQYKQRPFEDGGPLLGVILAVGGEDGDKSATPVGFGVRAKGWLDVVDIPYVGFDVSFRMTNWSLTAAEFNDQVAPDTLYNVKLDLAGRYPFEVGSMLLYAGGRLGFHINDFMYFTGSFDDGQILYQTLLLPSLGLSAEIGAEIDSLFVNASVGHEWSYGSNALGLITDVNAGYQLTDRLYLDAGMAYSKRTQVLEGKTSGREVGEVSDQQLVLQVGAGVSW